MNKICTRCRVEQSIDRFGKARNGKKGPVYRSQCKSCQSEQAKEWFANNRERTRKAKRAWALQKNYGITVEEYDKMYNEQNGLCAICGSIENNGPFENLSVDHCHVTGKVRGLLCNNCNRAVGLLKDNVAILKRAADYVERND